MNKIQRSLKIIRYAIENFNPIVAACSFGKDSMVMAHLIRQVDPDFQFFTVMTRHKPQETLDYKDKMTKEWKMNIREYRNDDTKIPNDLYAKNPDECCRLLKVLPTKRALEELKAKAWIAGIRNTEGLTRKDFYEIEYYEGGMVKINPILIWTEADIWRYMAVNKIPVHPWYGKGYRSLGCAPCSKPYTEEERGGRWAFDSNKCGSECGIHSILYKKIKGKNFEI